MSEGSTLELERAVDNAIEATQWFNFNTEQWRLFLETSIPKFNGDYANAARLMYSFGGGIKYVNDRYNKYGYSTNLESLPITLMNYSEGTQAFIYSKNGTNKICFELSALKTMSLMNQEKDYKFDDMMNEPT